MHAEWVSGRGQTLAASASAVHVAVCARRGSGDASPFAGSSGFSGV